MGISEILGGNAILDGGTRSYTVSYNGIRLKDHVSVSGVESQIVSGDLSTFNADQMSVLVGSRVAEIND